MSKGCDIARLSNDWLLEICDDLGFENLRDKSRMELIDMIYERSLQKDFKPLVEISFVKAMNEIREMKHPLSLVYPLPVENVKYCEPQRKECICGEYKHRYWHQSSMRGIIKCPTLFKNTSADNQKFSPMNILYKRLRAFAGVFDNFPRETYWMICCRLIDMSLCKCNPENLCIGLDEDTPAGERALMRLSIDNIFTLCECCIYHQYDCIHNLPSFVKNGVMVFTGGQIVSYIGHEYDALEDTNIDDTIIKHDKYRTGNSKYILVNGIPVVEQLYGQFDIYHHKKLRIVDLVECKSLYIDISKNDCHVSVKW